MSAQDVETLRAGYDAFARQDIPTVLDMFQPDIDWRTPDSTPVGGHYRGRDEVTGFFGKLAERFTHLSVEPTEFIDAGDTIVVVTRNRGAGPAGSFDMETIHLWRMRDGKAASFREYLDTARILQALGEPVAAAS